MKPIRWRTNDGIEFDDLEVARAHYAKRPELALLNLSQEDIESAIIGGNPDVATAIQSVAAAIAVHIAAGTKRVMNRLKDKSSIYEPGRGARDFHAGICGITPDDLKGTPAGELWLTDWDQASRESFEAKTGRAA